MRRVRKSALVPYSAREMYRLVDDVEAYPEFLPWCSSARVLSESGDTVEASLELHKGQLRKSFTTRNHRLEFSSIDIALVGGPFRHLDGGWRFEDLGGEGCKVTLSLDFEFDSMFADLAFGRFFEDTCNSLVDAFTRRAVTLYGER